MVIFNLKVILASSEIKDCGGGLVVSVLTFYSDDPRSNTPEVCNFSVNILFGKNKAKEKEAGVGRF